jgi:signal transduction histidine kinase
VAVDIHDGPLQKAILLAQADDEAAGDPGVIGRELVAELREISTRLRPSILDDLGLVPALEWLLDDLSDRSVIVTSLSLHGIGEDERLQADSELALFRITQEAINNVLKHSHANRLEVSLSREGRAIVLQVSDDGEGFSQSSYRNGGLGLSGMRERVIQLDGSFEVSSAPGSGTLVTARVPIESSLPSGGRA